MSTASAKKSPRPKTPRAAAPSPTRITRLEEKEELAELNKRLEVYILKNREKDASQGSVQREIDAVRERAEDELQRVEDLHQQQLADLRKARDDEKLANARLNTEHKANLQELEAARVEIAQLRQTNDRLHDQNQDLQGELAKKNMENAQLQNQLDATKGQLAVVQSKLAGVEADLEQTRNALQEAQERADVAEAKLDASTSNTDNNIAKLQAEIKRLRKELDEVNHKGNHVEDELRAELSAQLTEIIAQRQLEWEEDKGDALAELKAVYDEKVQAYRDHLERAGHELEMAKAQREAAIQEAEENKTLREEFEATRTTLKNRIVELEEAVKSERSRPSRELAEKIEIIRRLKAAFKRKDEEFDQLMDVKIALAMEIKAYRQLLEKEEQRLGYKSPATGSKRRRTGGSSFTETHSDDATLRFSGIDVHGRYITIRNEATEDTALEGWVLRSSALGNTLDLPADIVLSAGQSLTIWTGAESKEKHNPPTDVGWETNGNAWDDVNGDVAELIDPEGNLVGSVDIVPEHYALPDGASADGTDQQKCIVM